jgi:hypothetical protein
LARRVGLDPWVLGHLRDDLSDIGPESVGDFCHGKSRVFNRVVQKRCRDNLLVKSAPAQKLSDGKWMFDVVSPRREGP